MDGITLPHVLQDQRAKADGLPASICKRVTPHDEVSDEIVVSGEDTSVGSKCAGCVGGGCTYGGVRVIR